MSPANTRGHALKALRTRKGMTQAALAEWSGLSLRGVIRTEMGQRAITTVEWYGFLAFLNSLPDASRHPR